MKLWNLGAFAMLGLVSIIYGLIRSNLLDIALGVAVLSAAASRISRWGVAGSNAKRPCR